ncbi:dipicolinate synthase subunit DpsA [Lacrimispora indolis]|uniref:dipicolinate synthase subunit DpsA n=1 Tax=Lacrimispora indolis TaxID=69825 RepID=UPI00045EBD61|nr:dipicolinate synthase subunit DpsA [Lacrimispora indolis]
MHNFLLLGGDSRQLYLNHMLIKNGFQTTFHYSSEDPSFSMEEAIKNNNVILCPIPFTRDKISLFSVNGMEDLGIGNLLSLLTPDHILFGGSIPAYVKEYAEENHIACFDYMDMEDVTVKNTIATAEGAIAEAIRLSPGCLHKSRCLVTGFGRCAKTLAMKLKGLDAVVTVAGRKETQLAAADSMGLHTRPLSDLALGLGDYQFIFNTIPALILEKDLINSMDPDVTIIDIASAPGGVDFDFCRQQNIRAKLCPGLPGIYAPGSSAEILFEAIVKYLS